MEPLESWDAQYITDEVVKSAETNSLEKKASKKLSLKKDGKPDGECKAELAKQVSAFSNSGDGFLVYGIDDNGALDDGVPITINGQPIKDWIEATIPTLLHPHATRCQARVIQVQGHHALDKCILVISIPLSDARPHWVTAGPNETAYLRAGAHSLPMRPQSFLDIASRQGASAAEILDLRQMHSPRIRSSTITFQVQPIVRLVSGSVCQDWSFEIRTDDDTHNLSIEACLNSEAKEREANYLYYLGKTPLFPHRPTPVMNSGLQVTWAKNHSNDTDFQVEATLYLGTGTKVTRTFHLHDFDPIGSIIGQSFS